MCENNLNVRGDLEVERAAVREAVAEVSDEHAARRAWATRGEGGWVIPPHRSLAYTEIYGDASRTSTLQGRAAAVRNGAAARNGVSACRRTRSSGSRARLRRGVRREGHSSAAPYVLCRESLMEGTGRVRVAVVPGAALARDADVHERVGPER